MFLRSAWVRHWSEQTIIVLVMQSLDNSLTVFRKKGLFGAKLSSKQGHGEPNPTWIPVGNDVTRRLSEKVDGFPGGTWGEVFNIPMTAHIIGGCPIGDSPATGVLDPWQRVYGYDGLRPRRIGRHCQPRRQSLAHDHGAGRAGDGVLAQQGGDRRASAAGLGVPAVASGRAAPTRGAGRRAGRAAAPARVDLTLTKSSQIRPGRAPVAA
jgi:hypothetical protein